MRYNNGLILAALTLGVLSLHKIVVKMRLNIAGNTDVKFLSDNSTIDSFKGVVLHISTLELLVFETVTVRAAHNISSIERRHLAGKFRINFKLRL